MKGLPIYINERFSTNKDEIMKYYPTSYDELIGAIKDHFNNGNGDLNDIGVSELTIYNFYCLFHDLKDEIEKNNIVEINISTWKLKKLYCHLNVGIFEWCDTLETIILPDCLEVIDRYAFCNCKKLNNIIIPNSVKTIDSRAFYKCDRLSSLIIPDSVISISENAFLCCPNLTITIPNVRVERLVLDSGFNGEIIIK